MAAAAFYPQSLLSFNKQLKLGKPILSTREIADPPSHFAFQKNPHKLTIVSIKSDGSRRGQPPQKGSPAGRRKKGNGKNTSQLPDTEVSSSSNQQEIISLFKRIQSSISKGDSVSTKQRKPNSSEDKQAVESVIDVLHRTRKEVKVTSSIKDREVKKQEIQKNDPMIDFKLTRSPSNFVKRSPIPSPSVPRGNFLELNSKASAKIEQVKQPRVEELKLPQLKELAKARGLKGYSRLKKSELVKLLRS